MGFMRQNLILPGIQEKTKTLKATHPHSELSRLPLNIGDRRLFIVKSLHGVATINAMHFH